MLSFFQTSLVHITDLHVTHVRTWGGSEPHTYVLLLVTHLQPQCMCPVPGTQGTSSSEPHQPLSHCSQWSAQWHKNKTNYPQYHVFRTDHAGSCLGPWSSRSSWKFHACLQGPRKHVRWSCCVAKAGSHSRKIMTISVHQFVHMLIIGPSTGSSNM